jgi:hypothetical protein
MFSRSGEQIAEQAIQIEALHEQDQVQAAAFRAAQTQLPTTIRDLTVTCLEEL